MPAGLQVWDALGNLILDTSSEVGRFHGVITLNAGYGAGSQNIPSLSLGRPFILPIFSYNEGYYDTPSVSLSGTTISWGTSINGNSVLIYYGTY